MAGECFILIVSQNEMFSTVDKSQHVEKMPDLLQNGTYTPLAHDSTSKFERQITLLIKSSNLPLKTQKRIILGNPKIEIRQIHNSIKKSL